MQEFGGFEIKFINNVDIDQVKNLIVEMVDGIEEWLYVDGNRICVDSDFPLTYGDFEDLFEAICKRTVSIQPKSSFNGIAQYSNLSVNFDFYQKSGYRQRKKELVVESIQGEFFDGCCPECGRKLFNPKECRCQDMYHCDDCSKDFKFDTNYRKDIWLLKDGKFEIKNI